MQSAVYHSADIQAWEQDWFAHNNSAFGLMQQAAWQVFHQLSLRLCFSEKIVVCCGGGNNGGDGYLIATYLYQAGYQVQIYAAPKGASASLAQAYQTARDIGVPIVEGFSVLEQADVYIDALFGIGLNRELSEEWQSILQALNTRTGLKIAIDVPSGLHPDTGQILGRAFYADITYTFIAHKLGLCTGQAKDYVGKVVLVPLIPPQKQLAPIAQLAASALHIPQRSHTAHKGHQGHVLVIGGHADMGGAVIMAAEAAFACGAGKVTVVCDVRHHQAILARAPNIMVKDINACTAQSAAQLLTDINAVCFGMGLGRDDWAAVQYHLWMPLLSTSTLELVLDADALWFLAKQQQTLRSKTYATPHPGEAATLLGCQTTQVEENRAAAIHQLQQKYAGQWVLKGAGSLVLEDQLWVCQTGNAGMATGGMGDILAGMIASLKAQFHAQIPLHDIVTLHGLAGDELAQHGIHGLQAPTMPQAIAQVMNRCALVKVDESPAKRF